MEFAAAPEYQVFPTRERALKPYEAAVRAAAETRPLVASSLPDAVVVDVLTVAGGLAAELEGRPWVTLRAPPPPHPQPGFPPVLGRRAAAADRPRRAPVASARSAGRARRAPGPAGAERRADAWGLDPVAHEHGGISRALALVATFPQLEYPRATRPAWARITGPLLWERDGGSGDEIELPPGDGPLVLVAPSTSQDPVGSLMSAALEGLRDEPVRVLGVLDPGRSPAVPRVPGNARLVPWLSYARAMPQCAAVVCHAGHGTLARALASGAPVVACPAAGDMAENAARARVGGRRGVAAAEAADPIRGEARGAACAG